MPETTMDTISDKENREEVLFAKRYVETKTVMVPYKRPYKTWAISQAIGGLTSVPLAYVGIGAVISDFHPFPTTLAVLIAMAGGCFLRREVRSESLNSRIPRLYGGLEKGHDKQVLKAARKKSRKQNPGQVIEVESDCSYKRYRLKFLEEGIEVAYLDPIKPKKDWDRKLEMVKSAYNIETPPGFGKKFKKKRRELEDV